jgi:hypothetical protein
MADSLFDNRYRYDYIYPRGRSGETLRAVDTQAEDRPVVIKRPAPNDAPPIRAGQEVSILNERKALTRLAGHPVLTALVGGGQFFVGGIPHQYIAMERAEGWIVADAVRELAARGERLPHLEMLVIMDSLLDLLNAAHARDIVYNDVDAKHLFWDRDHYRLKVIDWGNAVFLEGDEVTPQGVSRQSDIFQAGELLYFILSGGNRPDIPRDAGDDFRLDFGDQTAQIHSRLQSIVSKALHPSAKMRYQSIADLRKDLADFRAPYEKERDSVVTRVNERLRRTLSKNELRGLLGTLEPALATDPGFPPARQAYEEIIDRLRDLEVSADLDAVRIYMESANWQRAADLLKELREKAGAQTRKLINLLMDCTVLLIDTNLHTIPLPVMEALLLLFDGQPEQAAQLLLTQEGNVDNERALQWLLAERISSHIPEVLLLRPNLYRLEVALNSLSNEGLVVTEPRVLLNEINHTINSTPASGGANLAELRDRYRQLVDQLTALTALLEPLGAQHNLSNRKLPLTALQRALNAAMALADNMHVIGKQATGSPRDAIGALDSSRSIDPTNPLWDMIGKLLNGLYELLQTYQTFVPAADGTDLDSWLKDSQRDLSPFVERLFDEMLVSMVDGLENATEAWASYSAAVIHGNRAGAVNALSAAIDGITTISPTLAGWLNQLRNIITGAAYIERHAVFGGLGRAMADGWEAFDRGRLADAERLGQQAYEISRNEPERFAAKRLRNIAQTMRDWVERSGVNNGKRSESALTSIEELFTTDENNLRESFAAQMPSKDTYLRAMSKGLVEIFARNSTAANRILSMSYVLLGTLDAHEAKLDDGTFWRDAAIRALGEHGQRHPAIRALDEFIERRRDLDAAADLLNQVNGSHALATLDSTRRQLEENKENRTLAAAIHSLRELEAALRDWSDGEFRPAGIKLENAINAVNEVEKAADITLTTYRAFLMDLQAHAAELHNVSRGMRQAIERRGEKPDDTIREAHQRQVDVTTRVLGQSYAATLRQWRDTYESFLGVYADPTIRRSAKLIKLNELFKAMFIDRHPAYPLYRHWQDLTESSPEFPAPPTDEPFPRVETDVPESEYRGSRYIAEGAGGRTPIRIPRGFIYGGIIGLVVIVVLLVTGVLNPKPDDLGEAFRLTITDTPTVDASGSAAAILALNATDTRAPGQTPATPTVTIDPRRVTPTLPAGADFNTPTVLPVIASITPTEPPSRTPTNTPAPSPTDTATNTASPTNTDTPTATYTPSNTPTPTLPPEGLQGEQDLLALFNRLTEFPWSSEMFSLTTTIEGTYWRLGVGAPLDSGEPFETMTVWLPVTLLDTYYGNNAGARIRRMEATLTLRTYNPALLESNQVYFGAIFINADNLNESAGLQIEVTGENAINLSRRMGESVTFVSQKAVNSITGIRIRLERDLNTGAVTLFYNDEAIGQPIELPPDVRLLPALFAHNGGVIVSITDWEITLR